MCKWAVLSCIVALFACSTLQKPPTVDGTHRQAVNSPETAKKLALRAELLQTQELQEQETQSAFAKPPVPLVSTSRVIIVYFPYNSTIFRPTQQQETALLPYLPSAKRIEIRGRTDGQRPSEADERIALGRAMAAKRYLIAHGVPSMIISINYVAAGDYLADNRSVVGRSRNRRVEIELFSQ